MECVKCVWLGTEWEVSGLGFGFINPVWNRSVGHVCVAVMFGGMFG